MKVDYSVFCLSYAPNGDILAVGGEGGNINFFNSQGEKLQSPVRCDGEVLSVAYSPDGTKLTAGLGYSSYSVVVFDTQTNEQICSLNVGGVVFAVVFAACGNKLAASCNDYPDFTVKILSKEGSTGNFAYQPTAREMKVDYRILCLSYAPKGDILAVGDEGGNVNFFNSQGEKLQSPVRGHSASVNCVDFSPDGLTIASGSGDPYGNDNSVRVWDVKTGKQLWQLTGHTR